MRNLLRFFFPFSSIERKKSLAGKKIDLSFVRKKDLSLFFSMWEQQDIRDEEFLPISEHLFQKKFTETGFWSENFGVMLIYSKDHNCIGAIGFHKKALEALTLTYVVDRKFTDDSVLEIMKESISLFSSFLFSTKTFERLQLFVPDYQKLFITIAQRSSFSFEGIFRRALFKNGKYLDVCVYSLLREEWEENDKNIRSPFKTRRNGACI